MARDEEARYQIGANEFVSDKKDRAVKHWTIAASSGSFKPCMLCLLVIQLVVLAEN